MRFLVDAQLPTTLARWLQARGHEATHVRDIEMDAALDQDILRHAEASDSIIGTKDADFAHLSSHLKSCRVVWLRLGTMTKSQLLAMMEQTMPDIEGALAQGEKLVVVER